MTKYLIRFQDMEHIISFVRKMEKLDLKADLVSGSLEFDAKSLMGLLTLNINKAYELQKI